MPGFHHSLQTNIRQQCLDHAEEIMHITENVSFFLFSVFSKLVYSRGMSYFKLDTIDLFCFTVKKRS